MKKETFSKITEADLTKLLTTKREEVRKLRFDMAGSRGKNTKAITALRKGVARILTELSARTRA